MASTLDIIIIQVDGRAPTNIRNVSMHETMGGITSILVDRGVLLDDVVMVIDKFRELAAGETIESRGIKSGDTLYFQTHRGVPSSPVTAAPPNMANQAPVNTANQPPVNLLKTLYLQVPRRRHLETLKNISKDKTIRSLQKYVIRKFRLGKTARIKIRNERTKEVLAEKNKTLAHFNTESGDTLTVTKVTTDDVSESATEHESPSIGSGTMKANDTNMAASNTNGNSGTHNSEDDKGTNTDNTFCPECNHIIGEQYVRCDWECQLLYHLSCVGLQASPNQPWCCKTCIADVKNWKGAISWIPVGTTFKTLEECVQAYLHRTTQGGIHGSTKFGAFSVVISGDHDGDKDEGESFIFTGQDGHGFLKSVGQRLTGNNLALAKSCAATINPKGTEARNWKQGDPIRVIRWIKHIREYRYDGIYKITKYWREQPEEGEKEEDNYPVYKYRFERDDITPLPSNEGEDIDEEA